LDFQRPFLFVLFVLPSLLGAHGDLGWWKDPILFLRTGDRGLISTARALVVWWCLLLSSLIHSAKNGKGLDFYVFIKRDLKKTRLVLNSYLPVERGFTFI